MTSSAACATAVCSSASRSTGKERDTESGNDYFGARYYASTMGRFMSPDPLPWIHWQNGNKNDREKFAAYIANPQNFDLYAYVLNNPLSKTDPTGMYVCNGGQQQCQAVQNSLDAVKRAADAPNNGTSNANKVWACRADVAINYGLGFIPGYNAAKAVFTLAGGNVNFVQNAMSGKSIVTFNNPFNGSPSIFWGPNALASGYNAIMQSAKNIGNGAVLEDVAKAAGTANTIANVLNTASAINDAIACGSVHN